MPTQQRLRALGVLWSRSHCGSRNLLHKPQPPPPPCPAETLWWGLGVGAGLQMWPWETSLCPGPSSLGWLRPAKRPASHGTEKECPAPGASRKRRVGCITLALARESSSLTLMGAFRWRVAKGRVGGCSGAGDKRWGKVASGAGCGVAAVFPRGGRRSSVPGAGGKGAVGDVAEIEGGCQGGGGGGPGPGWAGGDVEGRVWTHARRVWWLEGEGMPPREAGGRGSALPQVKGPPFTTTVPHPQHLG